MPSDHFEAVIVGAGFGGIGAAIQLSRLGYDDFVILERESDLGGTWLVNHYPGLAVDVPTTTYSYYFAPNPNWSRLFSTGAEIKQYADDVADSYDVRRHMRFDSTVDGARWDDEAKLWRLTLAGGGTVTARMLITATGFLSQPQLPDIPGITRFDGKVIHTADWDDTFDPADRHVAVIGTGATAVQLIPELAEEVAELTVFQRTPIWVFPKIDFRFLKSAKRVFRRVPVTQRVVRAITDAIYEFFIYTGLRHRRLLFRRLIVGASDVATLFRFVQVRDKELRERLTPDYDLGCKRPTFSNRFYPTLSKPHVHLQDSGIERIEPDGIVAKDGTKTYADTLVSATGFNLWDANFPAIEVIGRKGRNLGKWWRETRFQAYQGVSVPYFPNFLSLASPYAFLGLNFFNTIEYQMRHMARLFGEMKRRGAETFEVTEAANARYLDRMTDLIGDSVFAAGNCATARSYYFNPSGEPSLLRPMSTRAAIKEASQFPLSDYRIA